MASLPPLQISDYRGRVAPSPTGYLHVGHARTFWTAWQRARNAGGTMVMRMEDLDPDRSRPAFAEAALEDLRWLGIRWHEGPDCGGPHAPYTQSRRKNLYQAAWKRLVQGGWIYPCNCSRKDLAQALSAPHEENALSESPTGQFASVYDPNDEPIYPGTCRHKRSSLPIMPGNMGYADEIPANVHWRFRVPDGEAIEFNDQNLGPQSFVAGRDFGDFIVLRRDGVPSYQLACAVDDAEMEITEVVRGADLLKSTARQILLNRALGYRNPEWFHCRLIVDQNGQRLAKRHDSLSLRSLRQRGITPMRILSAELPEELA